MNPFDKIDMVYYINLDKREDRKKSMLDQFTKLSIDPSKIKRIPGVIDKYPELGCSKAHLVCLLDAIENNYSNYLVLEDDFVFIDDKEKIYDSINGFTQNCSHCDVLLLGGNLKRFTRVKNLNALKIICSKSTYSYIVRSHYYNKLKENFEKGIELFEKKYDASYCVDTYWKNLQKIDNWYILNPQIGCTYAGYSDIAQRYTSCDIKLEH